MLFKKNLQNNQQKEYKQKVLYNKRIKIKFTLLRLHGLFMEWDFKINQHHNQE